MIRWSQSEASTCASAFVIMITLAPRERTSRTFDIIFAKTFSCVAIAITGTLSVISEIVPCFNSPAA